MFLLRGIAVSLAFYVLVYCGLSILILSAWDLVGSCRQHYPGAEAYKKCWQHDVVSYFVIQNNRDRQAY